MSQPLPYASFEWCDDILNADHVLNYKNENKVYILEVDMEYPKELHDLHSDYPFAPENMFVSANMVSDFSKSI